MRKYYKIILAVFVLLPVCGSSTDRKIFLLAEQGENPAIQVLEFKPSGELIWTGQSLETSASVAVSPDQNIFWTTFADSTTYLGIKQYVISSFGLITTTGRTFSFDTGTGGELAFTPNGELLLMTGDPPRPIFRVYPDGSIESTANVLQAGLAVSPRGDINWTRLPFPQVNSFRVDYIDYNSYTVSSLQVVSVNGQPQKAVYTPNGEFLIYTKFGGGTHGDIDVRKILPNGMIDTTKLWEIDVGTLNVYGNLDITPDGLHVYIGIQSPSYGITRLDWLSNDTPFVYSGIITPITYPSSIRVSPDGKYLLVQYMMDVSPFQYYMHTFAIQTDGSLMDTGYDFPHEQIFGDGFADIDFAWPPAPTKIPPELWMRWEE